MSELVHGWAPHSSTALYGCTMICAAVFAALGTLISLALGRGFSGMLVVTQAASGASFPTFVLMPFVPFDEDLITALGQSWFNVALAGVIGAGITIYSLWHHPKPNGNGNGG